MSKNILFGLSENSTNEEIQKKAFELIGKIRFMPAATVNKGMPELRILDFNQLSDGNLYFMTSKGKPTYKQIMENNALVLSTLIDERYSVRFSTVVEVITDQKIWDEFFYLNPGTKLMYRKNLDLIALFRLGRGEGELFHLYEAEKVKRVRFKYEGGTIRLMTYKILKGCIGCGTCKENCVEEAIVIKNGRYIINNCDCDDCGICYSKCPQKETGMECRLLVD